MHAQIAAGMQIGVVKGGVDIIHVGEPGDAMYVWMLTVLYIHAGD